MIFKSKEKSCNLSSTLYFIDLFRMLMFYLYILGAEWKKHRRFVTPFLGHKYIESYFYVMKKSGEILINKLEEKLDTPTFDIEHYLSRCYQDTVSGNILQLKCYFLTLKKPKLNVIHTST